MADEILTVVQDTAYSEKELKDLDSGLAKNPNDVDLLDFVASAYYRSKKMDRAMELYSKVTELDPERASGWYFLGNCLYQLNHKQNAKECWEMVLELDSKGAFARKAKANLAEFKA